MHCRGCSEVLSLGVFKWRLDDDMARDIVGWVVGLEVGWNLKASSDWVIFLKNHLFSFHYI